MSAAASIIDPDVGTQRPLGPWANGMLMTPEEFDAEAEWDPDFRYELINGVLIVSPPAGGGETRPNDQLAFWLLQYQAQHPQGKVLADTVSEFTVRTATGRRRMDRAIWAGLKNPEDPLAEPPTIAIEFVADSSRDRRRDYVTKRQEYDEIGIKEYWMIDRFRRSMTVFRGPDVEVVPESQNYHTNLLPGFDLPIAQLLKLADYWAKAK